MSAEINVSNGRENVMVVGQPAWHGMGQVLENPATAAEAIEAAGLDYEVVKRPLVYGIDGHQYTMDGKFATVRTDTNEPLGVVGSHYQVLQNRDAFGFFDPIVDEDEAVYHTAGVLGKGERMWILAKLPEYIRVGKDDLIEQYALLYNSHDGGEAVTACITPIRVVCNNTLTAALRGARNVVKVRHTVNMQDGLAQAHELLGITKRYTEALQDAFTAMTRVKMSDMDAQAFLDGLYPQDPEKEVWTLGQKIKDGIMTSFYTSPGSEFEESKGTLYGLYNGLTHYFDHVRNYKSEDNRLKAVWFGAAKDFRQKAFNKAMELV